MIILERKCDEWTGRITVRRLGSPITQPAMDLIRFRVKTAPELRYFSVEKDEFNANQFEIERMLKSQDIDHEELELLGVQEIR